MSDSNPYEFHAEGPSFINEIHFKDTPGLKIYGQPSYKVHIRSFKPPRESDLGKQFGYVCNNSKRGSSTPK
jgi:hypothetical protein